MRVIYALAILMLVGCDDSSDGSAESAASSCPNVTYSWPNDVYGNSLTLKATGSAVTFIDFSEMEQIYRDVEVCVVDNRTPGPIVQFRSFKQLLGGGGWGIYAADGNAYINTDEDIVARNCHSDRATLKHEFVHHILYMNGQDWKHSNPAFAMCDALGAKVCDGVACP